MSDVQIPDIDNTAEAWGDVLRQLAEQARADGAQRDSGLVLTQILDDLSRVLDSYAVRLDGEEVLAGVPGVPGVSEAPGVADAPEAQDQGSNQAETQEALADVSTFREQLAISPAPAFDLPGWIRATLDEHYALIADHETRIAQLEGSLADALNRIAWLENNIGLSAVAADPSIVEMPFDPDDYNPDAWGSIERAREALTRQVLREYNKIARMRQAVLNAVMNLTDAPGLDDDQRAELAQHKARADRLDQIDVVRDAKIDEVNALNDLTEAKAYQTFVGWPR